MKHSRASSYIELYGLEELDPRVRSDVEGHLAECAECAARAAEVAAFKSLLASAGEPTLPRGFDLAVEAVRRRTLGALQSESQPVEGLLYWLRQFSPKPALAPMAVAALFLLVLFVRPTTKSLSVSPVVSSEPQALIAQAHPPQNFKIIRNGPDVRIEWPSNGASHRIRKASDPVSLRASTPRVVKGRVWTDAADRPMPGSVTFYLVD